MNQATWNICIEPINPLVNWKKMTGEMPGRVM